MFAPFPFELFLLCILIYALLAEELTIYERMFIIYCFILCIIFCDDSQVFSNLRG